MENIFVNKIVINMVHNKFCMNYWMDGMVILNKVDTL